LWRVLSCRCVQVLGWEEMAGGQGAFLCVLPVLRFGFRLSPGEFEGTGFNFAFYQVTGKAGLGPSASLVSAEPRPWVVMDNLPIGSGMPPQQALSVSLPQPFSTNCTDI